MGGFRVNFSVGASILLSEHSKAQHSPETILGILTGELYVIFIHTVNVLSEDYIFDDTWVTLKIQEIVAFTEHIN